VAQLAQRPQQLVVEAIHLLVGLRPAGAVHQHLHAPQRLDEALVGGQLQILDDLLDRPADGQQQRLHDIEKIDQQLLGLLKTREALLHVDPTVRDLSVALRDALRALERELVRRGEDFGQAVCARRRDRGLSVGLTGKIFPFRTRREDAELETERARELEEAIDASEQPSRVVGVDHVATDSASQPGPDLENDQGAEGGGVPGRVRTLAWLRWRSADTRMRVAFATLDAAELACRRPRWSCDAWTRRTNAVRALPIREQA